ncbi:MAG: biotin/lipoyl-containing protein [bacterium]
MKYFAKLAGLEHEIEINDSDEQISVSLNGKTTPVEIQRIDGSHIYSLIMDGHSYQLYIEPQGNSYLVALNGKKYSIAVEDEKARRLKSLIKSEEKHQGEVKIKAPMPGLIVKITVQEGQEIKSGDRLLIIEAMKMENEIRSHVDGRVKKICIAENDSVEKDVLLMILV